MLDLSAMMDTGLKWCGFRMFLLVPKSDGYKPYEVIEEFRRQMRLNISLDEFYKIQQKVLKKIINGKALVN